VTPIPCPRYSDFNYDTLTFSEALPWFKGALMIVVGCTVAGLSCMFGGSILDDLHGPAALID
jgi:hypothetical protein